MARQIVVDIISDSSKFGQGVDGAIGKVGHLGVSLKDIGIAGAAAKVGSLAVSGGLGLIDSAASAAIDTLFKAGDAFREDNVSQTKLAQALKNNIPNWDGNRDAIEAYAGAQEKLGFSDDEVRDSLGQLIGITHDATEAQKLNSLAQDISRAKGIDLATASDLVTKAYQGNAKGLKALGIDLGGAKTGADILDAAQKNVQGSAEAWAATNTGKLAVSNQKVQEAMEKVGSVVDGITTAVLPVFADVLSSVVDVLGQVFDAVAPIVQSLLKHLQPAFEKLLPVAQKVFGGIMTVVKALQPVFEFVFGAIGTAFEVLSDLFGTEVDVITTVIGTLVDVFSGLADTVGQVFGTIGKVIRGSINFVVGAVNGIIDAINGVQLHVHIQPPIGPSIDFDWNGLNLGRLPFLHQGGVVPGPPGSDVLAILQAGETVSPRGAPGQTVVINIDSFIGSDRDIDRFANKVAFRLRTLAEVT